MVCLAGMVSKSSPLPLHFCMSFDGGKVFLRPLVPALDAMAGSAMQCPTTAWLAGTRPFDLSWNGTSLSSAETVVCLMYDAWCPKARDGRHLYRTIGESHWNTGTPKWSPYLTRAEPRAWQSWALKDHDGNPRVFPSADLEACRRAASTLWLTRVS